MNNNNNEGAPNTNVNTNSDNTNIPNNNINENVNASNQNGYENEANNQKLEQQQKSGVAPSKMSELNNDAKNNKNKHFMKAILLFLMLSCIAIVLAKMYPMNIIETVLPSKSKEQKVVAVSDNANEKQELIQSTLDNGA